MFEGIRLAFAYRYAKRKKINDKIRTIKYGDKPKQPMSMGKKLTIFLLINFIIIQLYAMVVMFIFRDLSALPTFISTIIAEVVTLLGYQIKSTVENRSGGLIYELAMKNDAEG